MIAGPTAAVVLALGLTPTGARPEPLAASLRCASPSPTARAEALAAYGAGRDLILAEKWEGKPFNAPNDIVVHTDGGIWFTDPGYGILMNYEGHKAEMEIKEAVYRIDPKTLKMEKVLDDMFKPNGLCFSPDYKKLYVCDTGASHYEKAPKSALPSSMTFRAATRSAAARRS